MPNIRKFQLRRISIKGGSVQPVEIRSNGINIVRLINWGTHELRVSSGADPEDYPLVIVSGNGATNNLMDPGGIQRIFCYAAGDVEFGLMEIQAEDPMMILAMESVVANLLTSLPAGTAHIGSVGLDVGSNPASDGNPVPMKLLDAIPAGANEIGKVQVSGRRASVVRFRQENTDAIAAGASETATITPPVGYIARIKLLGAQCAAAVTGATSGAHGFIAAIGPTYESNGSFEQVATSVPAYNVVPSIGTDLASRYRDVIFDNANPLHIRYNNATDAAQAAKRYYYVLYELEAVVS